MESVTSDSLFDGRLQIRQFRKGYRFSIDAVILARHIRPRPGECLLDLGAGCGVVSLILAYRHPEVTVIGLEIQPDLARLARENVRCNNLQARVQILCADMKKVEPVHLPGPMDWVVSNPPYRKAAAGRLNPHPQRAVARHEIKVTLPDVIATAYRVLRNGGKFVAVYASDRMAEALHGMHVVGIEPKFCRMIHSDRTAHAKLALVEGIKGAHPGMVVAPPLFLHHKNGTYTSAAQKLFRP